MQATGWSPPAVDGSQTPSPDPALQCLLPREERPGGGLACRLSRCLRPSRPSRRSTTGPRCGAATCGLSRWPQVAFRFLLFFLLVLCCFMPQFGFTYNEHWIYQYDVIPQGTNQFNETITYLSVILIFYLVGYRNFHLHRTSVYLLFDHI